VHRRPQPLSELARKDPLKPCQAEISINNDHDGFVESSNIYLEYLLGPQYKTLNNLENTNYVIGKNSDNDIGLGNANMVDEEENNINEKVPEEKDCLLLEFWFA
jgi:hypothetical protein